MLSLQPVIGQTGEEITLMGEFTKLFIRLVLSLRMLRRTEKALVSRTVVVLTVRLFIPLVVLSMVLLARESVLVSRESMLLSRVRVLLIRESTGVMVSERFMR